MNNAHSPRYETNYTLLSLVSSNVLSNSRLVSGYHVVLAHPQCYADKRCLQICCIVHSRAKNKQFDVKIM